MESLISNFQLVAIQEKHDQAISDVITKTGAEFGAIGEGFGPSDEEVSQMSKFYQASAKSLYLVALIDDQVVGGCGIAPFETSNEVCELRKLFLLPDSRGSGIGQALTEQCLHFAKQQGFNQCYLDTCSNMTTAITLYNKLGFNHLSQPLAGTVHGGCNVWMLKHI